MFVLKEECWHWLSIFLTMLLLHYGCLELHSIEQIATMKTIDSRVCELFRETLSLKREAVTECVQCQQKETSLLYHLLQEV